MSGDPVFALFFWLFAITVVVSALMATFLRNIMKAALALFFTFFGMAGLFLLLAADFVAITQVVVYVGGILVLMLVGVMVTHRSRNALHVQLGENFYPAVFAGALMLTILVYAVFAGGGPEWVSAEIPAAAPTTTDLGNLLLTDYLLPFEVSSLTLLMALLGASFLARRRDPVAKKKKAAAKHSPAAGKV